VTTPTRSRRSNSRHEHIRPSKRHGRSSKRRNHSRVRLLSQQQRTKNARTSRNRLSTFIAAIVVIAILFSIRLAQVQLVSANRYARYGASQRIHTIPLAAQRGTIFDRNGTPLAVTAASKSIWVNPKQIKDAYVTANALAPLLQLDAPTLELKLHSKGSFVYVKRQIDPGLAKRIMSLKLAGVYTQDEPKRQLLSGSQTSVVGKVGVDNIGLSGLELEYNKDLGGKAGVMYAERDASGRAIPGGHSEIQPPVQGKDLVLTIDQSLQQATENALAQEVVKASAKGGMAIVMQTRTGDILAVSNLIRDKQTGDIIEAPNNMAATNVYEPGSVNKLITIAGALESGLVSPGTYLTVPPTIRVADKTFSEHDPHPTQNWNVTDIVANSSNVGTIEIGQMLGKYRVDKYMRKFGLGQKTAVNFPGESAGILLQPRHWYPTSIGTIPIGQGISVTALQMISAYNAIANGGIYVAPRLVRAQIDGSGKRMNLPPTNSHRVVSVKTARQMTGMLDEVTRIGTGTLAKINGYTVAGKTGTARKPKVGGAGYQDGAYVSSFAGFVPSEKPEFTAMVILDEPTPIYGGLVAAPVFAQIMKYALGVYQIAPPSPVKMPDVPAAAATALDTTEAQAAKTKASQTTSSTANSTTAQPQTTSQTPAASSGTSPPRTN
jgi:cell division protein FtsI (penicillin-binding protein 3)